MSLPALWSNLRVGIAALGALAGTACTSEQLYESTRTIRVDQCQDLSPPEREECMRQTHETPDEREEREKDAELPR